MPNRNGLGLVNQSVTKAISVFGILDTVFMCQEMCHDHDTFHDTQLLNVMNHDTFVDTFLDTVPQRGT